MFESIPNEMKNSQNWVCWKAVPNPNSHSGITKIPINPRTGQNAKTNDPSTWSDYHTAERESSKYSGIGFVFANNGFFGVDIDDCSQAIEDYNNGFTDNIVHEFIYTLKSYAEYSQSGNGIHIICKGNLPEGAKRNGKVEMYNQGRFFVMTGKKCSEFVDITECTESIIPLHKKYLSKSKEGSPSRTITSYTPPLLDDNQIIQKAINAKNGAKFSALFNGDIAGYPSQSEADLAFCSLLAFWCNGDMDMMDRIYRQSRLMRSKWDRKQNGSTYGKTVLTKAIENCNSYYAISPIKPTKRPNRHSNLPSWIVTSNKKLKVSPELLSTHIQKELNFFFAHKRNEDNIRCFWYENGVYKLTASNWIKAKIKAIISEYNTKLATTRAIEDTYKQLTYADDHHMISDEEMLDNDENIVNFQNGILCLDTMELLPHSYEYKSTIQIPCNWNPDADLSLPTFRKFIRHLANEDPETQKSLLESIGFVISNVRIHHFKRAFFLIGEGNSGKSVFLKFLCKLIGEENYAALPFDILDKRFSLSNMYHKRLVADDDCKYCSSSNISQFKQITGGSPIRCEEKGKQAFTFVYNGLFMVCSNGYPCFDGDKGQHVYNRILPIKCGKAIPNELQDKHILDKLYSEREGIVVLAIKALKDAIANNYNFTVSLSSLELLDSYKTANDLTLEFVDACCMPRSSYRDGITTNILYKMFKNWCQQNGELKIPTKKQFIQSLCIKYNVSSRDGIIHKTNGNEYYVITVKPECADELG